MKYVMSLSSIRLCLLSFRMPIFILIISFLNMIPFILKGLSDEENDNTFLKLVIVQSKNLQNISLQSIIISNMFVTTPLMFSICLDFIFDRKSQLSCIPRPEYLFTLFLLDLFLVIIIFSGEHLEFVHGTMNCRDCILSCAILAHLNSVLPSVFTSKFMKALIFGFCLCNIVDSFTAAFSETVHNYRNAMIFVTTVVSIAVLLSVRVLFAWMVRMLRMSSGESTTVSRVMSTVSMPCNFYVLFFGCYFVIGWVFRLVCALVFTDEVYWSPRGLNYLIVAGTCLLCGTVAQNVLCFQCLAADIRKAKQEVEDRKTFIRYISHEIRGPMNVVQSGLKVLEERCESRPSREDLIEIIHDIRMSNTLAIDIASEILTFDKVETGKMKLDLSIFSIRRFVKEVMDPFRLQATANAISFSVRFDFADECEDIIVCADDHKLAQVVRNLISNSMKFTPPRGFVAVKVSCTPRQEGVMNDGSPVDESKTDCSMLCCGKSAAVAANDAIEVPVDDMLVIEVVDSGAGISRANQKKLFKDIVQFNPGKLQKGGGTGLGLYICKGIVDLHQGLIEVQSEGEGLGSTFKVSIPLQGMNVSEADDSAGRQNANSRITPLPPSRPPSSQLPRVRSSINVSFGRQQALDRSSRSHRSNWSRLSVGVSSRYSVRSAPVGRGSVIEGVDSVQQTISRQRSLASLRFNQRDMICRDLQIPLRSSLRDSLSSISHASIDNRTGLDQNLMFDQSVSVQRSFSRAVEQAQLGLRVDTPESVSDASLPSRVLIVDDSKMSQKMMCRLMQPRFDECITADDGQDAVDKVKQSLNNPSADKFDVILMDFEMPVLNGPMACRQMRQSGYKGIIIGVTGNTSEEDISHFLDHGATHVLVKPLDVDKYDAFIKLVRSRRCNVSR